MVVAGTAAFRSALADALPERPFRVVLWDGVGGPADDGNGGPDVHRALAAGARARPARPRRARARPRLRHRRARRRRPRRRRSRLIDSWEPPPLDRRTKARLALAALRATGPVRPPGPPASELTPQGRFHSIAARLARGPPPLRRAARVLPPLPRPDDDLLVRDLLARRDEPRGGAGGQARARLPEARPQARPARARRRLRLGLVRDPRRAAPRRPRHRHHAVAAAGRDRAPPRRGGGRRRPHRLPRRRLPRARRASRSTPSPRSGWSSTSAPSRWTSTRGACAARCARARRCSTTASPTCGRRTRSPATSPRRYVFPDGAPQPLSRVLLALERAGLETHHIEDFRDDYAETLRHWARRARRERRGGDPARGRRARARVAAVPAGGAQRLRDRLHLDLPGPRVVIGEALVRVRRGAGVESEHRVAWATTDRGRGGRARAAGGGRPPTPARRSSPARRPSRSRRSRACAPACPSASASAPSTSRWPARRTAAATRTSGGCARSSPPPGAARPTSPAAPAEPRDPAAAIALREAGDQPAPVRHNCSGKHAFGLALRDRRGLAGRRATSTRGTRSRTRWRAGSPRPRGVEPGELARATDGCGMRTFSVPIARLAAAFGRLASGGLGPAGRAAGGGDDARTPSSSPTTARSTPS